MRPMQSRQQPEVVNPVLPEAIAPWVRSMAATFLHDPGNSSVDTWIAQLRARWQPERSWGVRDRGSWVATLRTEPRRLTVPGGSGVAPEVAVDALTNVTVAATHRRQGLMSRMLRDSLSSARDRGEVLSVLIAAEWAIYGRFGYAPATLASDYVLHRQRPGARCAGDMAGLRQVSLDEVAGELSGVFDRERRHWAGQMDRDPTWWQRNLGLDGTTPRQPPAANWVVHEGDDGIDGVVGWSPHGAPNLLAPEQQVEVQILLTANHTAYRNLWAYLTAIDGVDQVTLSLRPAQEPVRWLLEDARALVATRQYDFLWLRFLDVAAALSSRRYGVEGELVLEVSDPDAGGFASGRYALIGGPDGADCSPTRADPDLRVSQRALASAYLGGFRLPELAWGGGVSEVKPGALARADLMFASPRPPWNATWF